MKKLLSKAAAVFLMLCLCAGLCLPVTAAVPAAGETQQNSIGAASSLSGGWTVASNNTVTKKRARLFKKGVRNLTGVKYTPIAYLGSQVVAGTNHCFLARAVTVTRKKERSLALVVIYEALNGKVSVKDITAFDFVSLLD